MIRIAIQVKEYITPSQRFVQRDVTNPILQVENISKSFNGTVANSDVDLSVEQGTVHGILGPNGAGKTTLFDVVSGFSAPDTGVVYFKGEDVTGQSPDSLARRGLVRTFQLAGPFADLTVRRNLLAPYKGGIRSGYRVRSETKDRVEELLNTLELSEVATEAAGNLSGGQQQLLELGRVMMLEPDCLLLDEPTAGVNPVLQEQIIQHLEGLAHDGMTILLIEHDMEVLSTLSDYATVLHRGSIVTQGSFETVTADPRVRNAFLGTTGGNQSPGQVVQGESPHFGQESSGTPLSREAVPPPSASRDRASHQTPADERSNADGSGAFVDTPDSDDRIGGIPASNPATNGTDGNGATTNPDGWLIARDLVTGYGNHVVIDGVSVRSREGITCLLGPNGSGKSTLLKALAGIVPIWEGQLTYKGGDMQAREPYEFIEAGISMVPQREMVFEGLSIHENLLLGATTTDDEGIVQRRLEEVLETFPALATRLDQRASTLSGGQRTMLGIARGLMAGSDVLLLDEPTSSLAPSVQEDVFDLIQAKVSNHAQVILVEQNVDAALGVADYVYVLAQGQIQATGTPEELRDERDFFERFLGIT